MNIKEKLAQYKLYRYVIYCFAHSLVLFKFLWTIAEEFYDSVKWVFKYAYEKLQEDWVEVQTLRVVVENQYKKVENDS